MYKKQLPYCGELVRQFDFDRFLTSIMMPPDKRDSLWALFAFNHEIAKTREVVTDTTLGQIRLQWWRDALQNFYREGKTTRHEVFIPLAGAIQEYDLPREEFEQLLYAREFDLEDVSPEHMDGLIKYADVTTTPLNRLACRIIGTDEKGVESVSTAYAMTGLLRAIPYHEAQGRSYMPSRLDKETVVIQVIKKAEGFLDECDPHSRFLKLQHRMSRLYLQHLKHYEGNVYHARAQLPPPFFTIRLCLSLFW